MTQKDPNSIWLSNPSFSLTIVGAVLFTVPMVVQFIQTIILYKSYYFIVVFIGACLEVGGYIARAVSIKKPDTIVRLSTGSSLSSLTLFSMNAAPIRSPIVPHCPRTSLHRRGQLPPHLTSLSPCSALAYNTYPSNQGGASNTHLHHLRYRILLDPSIW